MTPKRLWRPLFSAALLLFSLPQHSLSQDASFGSLPEAPQPQNVTPPSAIRYNDRALEPENITLFGTPKRLLLDQKGIWTSPLRLKPSDGIWLAPFGIATGVLLGSDQHSMTELVHLNPDQQRTANRISNGALVSLAAVPVSTYLWSLFHYTPQAHETALLSGEAAIDSLAVNEAFKMVLRRDRPDINHAAGNFFSSDWNKGSFASNHSITAWSMASVIGSEYPGWLTRTAAYGLASTVSVSRVLSEQHFPSDVLVGSVAGWLIGQYVYRAHHNYALNPFDTPPALRDYIAHGSQTSSSTASLPTPPPPPQFALPPDPIQHRPPRPFDADPDTIGSTNVPMDSWIYPALERLAALGLIPTQNAAIRPWTRQECLRQLRQAQEIADRISSDYPGLVAEAQRLMTDLDRELSTESSSSQELALESTYARYGTIAGPALNDSFHFGQTWWNDFGRPQGRGSNAISG
ncbi:MAG TPA: phosphatase PAP2 family protein, partial [Edaphobacter sp.]